ncbi:Putative uncharacterized protein [Thermotoga neapolitana DSM 4359]|uniref:Uncharacterized protein n=1 Tax=Thermotoga neapolitana (strain ATCC 49049 / DSM 4359 / NBRC 107923 / NS-E) TaxID=309803 RepID=B9K6Z4_THENN|nr:Putative uncharacterized protein [Thermotoga neapolitana DSM 4359]
MVENGFKILITAPGKIHDDGFAPDVYLSQIGQSMGTLESGNDPLEPGKFKEGVQCFFVGHSVVEDFSGLLPVGMFGTDPGIIQTSRYGVCYLNLTPFILKNEGLASVKVPHLSFQKGSGVFSRVETFTTCLYPYQFHSTVYEGIEYPGSVASPSYTGQDVIRKFPLFFKDLPFCLFTYHLLKISHYDRVGMWSHHGSDDVVRGLKVRYPVSEGFVYGIFQGSATAFYGNHLRTEEFHSFNVRFLSDRVFLSHVYDTLHAKERSSGGRCHSVLARTSFRYYPCFPHPFCKKYLTECVVYLVGTGVEKILPFQVDLRTVFLAQPLCKVKWGGTARVVHQKSIELLPERLILCDAFIRFLEFLKSWHEYLRNVLTTVRTEVTFHLSQPLCLFYEFSDQIVILLPRGNFHAGRYIDSERSHHLDCPLHVPGVQSSGKYEIAKLVSVRQNN